MTSAIALSVWLVGPKNITVMEPRQVRVGQPSVSNNGMQDKCGFQTSAVNRVILTSPQLRLFRLRLGDNPPLPAKLVSSRADSNTPTISGPLYICIDAATYTLSHEIYTAYGGVFKGCTLFAPEVDAHPFPRRAW